MDHDPFFAMEGDLDAARELVAAVGSDRAELYLYPGDQHLFTDSSLPSYDAGAAELAIQRSLQLLDRVGR
jgi:dienelactone hydrolase